MEIDIRMSAQAVTLLVFHPPPDSNNDKKRPGKKAANAGGTGKADHRGQGDDGGDAGGDAGGESGDEGSPAMGELTRQHSGGSVQLAEGELATEQATLLRDDLHLPALAASVVIDVRPKRN